MGEIKWGHAKSRIASAAGPGGPSTPGAPSLDDLIDKYQEMADLTKPMCMQDCPEPGGCCDARYCDAAEARAGEFGVQLPRQRHETLKYMGPRGCVVPPYLRPLCAVHVCEFYVLRKKSFARRYLPLREEVCLLEEALGPSWPKGMARIYWE
ncbi:MAG: hypothetical protein O7G32_10405 [SAR324 cluster bacterium]|nr:hypothetical protein [SAR324 cluster bacterium]